MTERNEKSGRQKETLKSIFAQKEIYSTFSEKVKYFIYFSEKKKLLLKLCKLRDGVLNKSETIYLSEWCADAIIVSIFNKNANLFVLFSQWMCEGQSNSGKKCDVTAIKKIRHTHTLYNKIEKEVQRGNNNKSFK